MNEACEVVPIEPGPHGRLNVLDGHATRPPVRHFSSGNAHAGEAEAWSVGKSSGEVWNTTLTAAGSSSILTYPMAP
jgi:hypothetical protein